jgi:Putative transposase/Transposase zinc-binding domain
VNRQLPITEFAHKAANGELTITCRNRHCPKCQGLARAQWLADRRAELLPVGYFHIIFTMPELAAAIALQNKAVVYDILFKAAAEMVRTIGADPKHLGAETGMIAILHTWGQTLTHHPHLHCIAPGGGLAPDGHWVACRPGFFLPVHILSRLYRRRFLERLQAAYRAGRLQFFGRLAALGDPTRFARALGSLRRIGWVVYVKPPFGDATQVLDYLARYTHRVAIANGRLLACDNGRVRFRWKDYRAGNKSKVMTLDANEFIRRFLLHVLPSRFRRIRHFGFLANTCRNDKLIRIGAALGTGQPAPSIKPAGYRERYAALFGRRLDVCLCCGGRMVEVATMPRTPTTLQATPTWDTS